jgi:hypothetical protein
MTHTHTHTTIRAATEILDALTTFLARTGKGTDVSVVVIVTASPVPAPD